MAMQRVLILVVSVACVVGCGGAPPAVEQATGEETITADAAADWQRLDESSLTPEQQSQLATGRAAQQAMAEQLMAKLTEAMDSGGPTAGIEVCAAEALRIAYEQAAAAGVQLGRTSSQLRNPLNEPPAWAAHVVAGDSSEAVIMAGPAGQLGALSPIILKAECEICHGPVALIDEELLTRIAASYPEDEATGFEAGDLRGWFWFEVPAAG